MNVTWREVAGQHFPKRVRCLAALHKVELARLTLGFTEYKPPVWGDALNAHLAELARAGVAFAISVLRSAKP